MNGNYTESVNSNELTGIFSKKTVFYSCIVCFIISAILLSVGAVECTKPENIDYYCDDDSDCSDSSTSEKYYGPCGGDLTSAACEEYRYCGSEQSTPHCGRETTDCYYGSVEYDCVIANASCVNEAAISLIVVGVVGVLFGALGYNCYRRWVWWYNSRKVFAGADYIGNQVSMNTYPTPHHVPGSSYPQLHQLTITAHQPYSLSQQSQQPVNYFDTQQNRNISPDRARELERERERGRSQREEASSPSRRGESRANPTSSSEFRALSHGESRANPTSSSEFRALSHGRSDYLNYWQEMRDRSEDQQPPRSSNSQQPTTTTRPSGQSSRSSRGSNQSRQTSDSDSFHNNQSARSTPASNPRNSNSNLRSTASSSGMTNSSRANRSQGTTTSTNNNLRSSHPTVVVAEAVSVPIYEQDVEDIPVVQAYAL
jgi:hypothetical protein